MVNDFLIRALIGGIGIALIAGPLGCFIVWRRMAYFGDALAHSALLGVALGLLVGIGATGGVLLVGALFCGLFSLFASNPKLSSDTLLGILSHSALAIGLCAAWMTPAAKFSLSSFLMGDILAISYHDIYWIYGGCAFILSILAFIWRPLLLITLHEELARAEGVKTRTIQFIFMILAAVTTAIAIKLIGALLITAMLIIPAATARLIGKSPLQTVCISTASALCAVTIGLNASWYIDLPSGPAIVLAGALLFVIIFGFQQIRK